MSSTESESTGSRNLADARRARLLEAGLELFGTAGYGGTTTRDICAAAQINHRFFYEAFKSREELLRAVYREIVREITEAVVTAMEGATSVEEQIERGMTAFWALMTSDRRKARILALEVVGVSADFENERHEARVGIAQFVGTQADALPDPRAREEPELDPGLAALSLIAVCIDLVVELVRGGDEASADELLAHGIRFNTLGAMAAFRNGTAPPPEG